MFLIGFLASLTSAIGQQGLSIVGGYSALDLRNPQFDEGHTTTFLQPHFGLVADGAISDRVSLRLGAKLTYRGGEFNENSANGNRVRSSFFELSPQIEYTLSTHFRMGVGTYVGWRLNNAAKLGNEEWRDIDYPGYEEENNPDTGLSLGLRGVFGRVFLGLRYEHCFCQSSA